MSEEINQNLPCVIIETDGGYDDAQILGVFGPYSYNEAVKLLRQGEKMFANTEAEATFNVHERGYHSLVLDDYHGTTYMIYGTSKSGLLKRAEEYINEFEEFEDDA